MNRFSGSEGQRFTHYYILIALGLTAGGWFLAGWQGALLCFSGSAAFLAVIWRQTRRRHRAIASFSLRIDRVLHGAEGVSWEDYREGELAILQNEIQKLLLKLRDQAEELKQDKKDLADYMADISHQMRTPLTSVHLILARLQNPAISEEQRAGALRDLQKMMQRMDWLIDALLKMSRLDSNTAKFNRGIVSVSALVQKASEGLAIPMELREQTLMLKLEEDASFEGDLSWSAEAVGNILKNCMEHTPKGGTVTVEASQNPLYCQIRIWDTGKGIDPEDLPHLFERFYRGKNASIESIGIGLALSRMIIARQNGTVKAENRSEGGACFTIKIYKDII